MLKIRLNNINHIFFQDHTVAAIKLALQKIIDLGMLEKEAEEFMSILISAVYQDNNNQGAKYEDK